MFRGKFKQKGIGQTMIDLLEGEDVLDASGLQLGRTAKTVVTGVFFVAALALFGNMAAPPASNFSLGDISVQLTSQEIDPEDENFYNRHSYISDNYHRCQNKLGDVHPNASTISLDANGRNVRMIEYSSIGMSYVVGVFNKSSELPKAVDFVKSARRENLKPIIRVGTSGDTDFFNTEALINFYNQLNERTADSKFIATLAIDFQLANQNKAALGVPSAGQFIGTQMAEVGNALFDHEEKEDVATTTPMLYESRQCGGSDDESSCIKINDQLKVFADRMFAFGNSTSEFDVTPLLFDFYFINWEDFDVNFKFTQVTQEGQTAPVDQDNSDLERRPLFAYQQNFLNDLIRNYEENGIVQRVIVGDFGPADQSANGDTKFKNGQRIDNNILKERLAYSYGELSDDPRIAGVIMSDAMDDIFAGPVNLQRLVLEGTNCNYDIVDYGMDYDERSFAKVAATTPLTKRPNQAEALTRVVCSGQTAGGEGGFCEAVVRYTVKVGLPVKHCGSNSPLGTDSMPYTPPAIAATKRYQVPLDYMNQNAGRLSTTGLTSEGVYAEDVDANRYMLPWLHTCLNAHFPDYTNTTAPADPIDINSHFASGEANVQFGGATVANTLAETEAEDDKFQYAAAWSPDSQAPTNVLDEFALCIGRDVCVSKYFIDDIEGITNFNQLDYTADTRIKTDVPSPITHVSRNPQNMIYGSEMILEETRVFAKGANQLAWEEYQHRTRNGGSLFSSKQIYELTANAGNATVCPCYYDANLDGQTDNRNYEGNPDRRAIGDSTAIRNGCQTTQEVVNGGQCVRYRGGEGVDSLDSYEESDFFVKAGFDSLPRYNIEGAYDSLYALYSRVQRRLSSLNLRLVANRNLGWEADVSVKAYSVPPWFKPRAIDGARENNFLETYDFGGINVPEPDVTAYSTPAPASGTGVVAGAASDSSTNACRVGLKFGIYASGLNDDQISEAANLNGEGKGYGYGHVILHGPNAVDGTSETVDGVVRTLNSMCSPEGGALIPVLGSCVRGRCGFSSGTEQGRYIASIINQVNCGSEIYVSCGHNEPKTDFEGTMAQEASWAKSCASTLRSNLNGSNEVKITTPAFNGTYNDGVDTFVDNITEFVNAYGASSIASDFVCVAANIYEDGGVPVGDRLSAIKGIPGLGDMDFCITETGVAVALEQGSRDPAQSSRVVGELLADEKVLFALGFNWTNANTAWESFSLSDKGALALEQNCDATRPVDGGSRVGGGNDIGIPGTYFENYNMYLTEVDNFLREYQYYEQLGWFDELHKLDQLLIAEPTVPLDVAMANLGYLPCEELPNNLVGKENCIAPYADPGSAGFQESNLGIYLCEKGYNVTSEVCSLQCTYPELGNTPENGGNSPLNPSPGSSEYISALQEKVSGFTGVVAEFPTSGVEFKAIPASQASSQVKITNFASDYGIDIAINTNFAAYINAPEGIFGGQGDVSYNDTPRGIEHALIKHDGSVSGPDPSRNIIAVAGDFAIVDVQASSDFNLQKRNYINSISEFAVTGVPLLVANGQQAVPADQIDAYRGISNDFSPRTIVGWKSGGSNFVFVVVNAADLVGMINISRSLGLDYALALDGGGSSQMYSAGGYNENVDQGKLLEDGTVYWPGRPGETGPRWRYQFLGVDLGSDGSGGSDTEAGTDPVLGTVGVCPVPAGYCIQGPTGTFSHTRVDENGNVTNMNAVDLVSSTVSYDLIAPFDGRVKSLIGNYCRADSSGNRPFHAGDGLFFEGEVNGQTVTMLFYHVKLVDESGNRIVNEGQQFRKGQKISVMSRIGDRTIDGKNVNSTTCKSVQTDPDNKRHIHMEFTDNTSPGRSIDMMAFSNALGCGSNDGNNGCSGSVSIQPTEQEGPLVCKVPETETPPGSNAPILSVFNCLPGNANASPNNNYSSLTEMIASAANIVGVDPGLINSIIEVEYAGVNQPPSFDIATIYGGNPNQYKELVNSLSCVGPGQFCPDKTLQAGTIFEYFSASGHAYNKVLSCAEQLGVSVNQPGQNICPAHIGNAICGAMNLIKDRVPGMSVNSTPEQRYESGRRYYGSCATSAGSVYCSLLRGDFEGRGYNKYSPRY